MRVARGRAVGASELRSATFTGRVWADPILPPQDGVVVNDVLFEPGARTHWHSHEVAQILHVRAGEGWLQVQDGDGQPLTAADTAHIPAGEVHWHGATATSFLLHLAVSVGETAWLGEVTDEDYRAALGDA